jgi:subtilase family serine protease
MRGSVAVLCTLFTALLVASSLATVPAARSPTSSPSAGGGQLTTDAVPLPEGVGAQGLPPATPISLTFTLTNPNAAALDRFFSEVQDPTSPSFRHFLTFPEFVSRFAPPASSLARIESTLAGSGGTSITAFPDRSSVSAVLPAGSVEQLLGVRLMTIDPSGHLPVYTAVGTVSLPPGWDGLVTGVTGLSNAGSTELTHATMTRASPVIPLRSGVEEFVHDNASAEDWFMGSDFTQAYGATDLFPGAHSVPNATYPNRVAVATLLASAFNQTFQVNLPPWDPAVLGAYFNGTLAPGWPMPRVTGVPVTVNGITPPLPGSYGVENDSTLYEYENSLDLEMAGSLAPGASLFNFYFAGSLLGGSATVGDAANYLATDLAQALAYSYSPEHLAAVSCSFGLPDQSVSNPAWNAELATAAATGVTILSASGDQGNAPDSLTGRSDGQWPVWPATASSGTSGSISVGGVSLDLSGAPSSYYNGTSLNLSYDAGAGSIASVAAWYDSFGGITAGTEGGASTVFPEPGWQFDSAAQPAIVNATVLQGASALGRAGPDLAMPANRTLVTVLANSTGTIFFTILDGTSVASPVLAGLLADVVAVENNRSSGAWTSLGFIDPEIYRIASYFAAHPSAVSTPFEDVTVGKNYVFSAAPGWDATTGWGGVNAPAFLAADENATLRQYNYTGPTPGLPGGPAPASGGSVPWTLIFAIFGVGIVVAIVLVLVAARPSRRTAAPPGVPWGAHMSGPAQPPTPLGGGTYPGGIYPGATYLCPHCGSVRPSEPVRCPRCGAF